MVSVVFTGPAFDGSGRPIVRQDLIGACLEAGEITVLPRVRDGIGLLVASRVDTVKALAAAARGIPIMTYPDFIRQHLRGVEIKKGAKPNRYADSHGRTPELTDYTEGLADGDIL